MPISEKTITKNQRMQLHRLFEAWINDKATEEDAQTFFEVREDIAPGEVCSVLRIAVTCLNNPAMFDRLPISFQEELKVSNWPLGDSVALAV